MGDRRRVKVTAAVLDALLATYNRTDLLNLAVAALRRRATSLASSHQAELATVRADLRRTSDSTARYLQAFEKHTLPEDVCATVSRHCVTSSPSSTPARQS